MLEQQERRRKKEQAKRQYDRDKKEHDAFLEKRKGDLKPPDDKQVAVNWNGMLHDVMDKERLFDELISKMKNQAQFGRIQM
jgi:hypothetical protein